MINNNRALTFTCCINESGFHLYIFIQGKEKVPVHLRKKVAALCWKWESHIYVYIYIYIYVCVPVLYHSLLIHLQVPTSLYIQNEGPWYPFIHCEFHSHLHLTSDRYTGNLCSLYIIVIIISSLPINVINWPCQ